MKRRLALTLFMGTAASVLVAAWILAPNPPTTIHSGRATTRTATGVKPDAVLRELGVRIDGHASWSDLLAPVNALCVATDEDTRHGVLAGLSKALIATRQAPAENPKRQAAAMKGIAAAITCVSTPTSGVAALDSTMTLVEIARLAALDEAPFERMVQRALRAAEQGSTRSLSLVERSAVLTRLSLIPSVRDRLERDRDRAIRSVVSAFAKCATEETCRRADPEIILRRINEFFDRVVSKCTCGEQQVAPCSAALRVAEPQPPLSQIELYLRAPVARQAWFSENYALLILQSLSSDPSVRLAQCRESEAAQIRLKAKLSLDTADH